MAAPAVEAHPAIAADCAHGVETLVNLVRATIVRHALQPTCTLGGETA